MRKAWFQTLLVLALVLIIGNTVQAQNDVTFRVRMSIKMLEGSFQPGSGDIVRVAGSFNDWGNSTDTLKDAEADSIYEKTVSLPAGAITYKFLKTLRGGLDWEGGDNRAYSVSTGSNTLPVVWFDYDSVYTPPVAGNVTFKVNMRVNKLEGSFRPDSNDIVRVAGSFNDWGNSLDTLRDVAPADSIYEKTVTINSGLGIQYKFLKTLRGGLDWEGGGNKTHTVEPGPQTLPTVWFDGDSLVSISVSGNLTYRVDLRAMQQLGWFVPPGDSVQVRGAFNSWGGTPMNLSALTGLYQVTVPYNGFSFDFFDYKFFMKLDSATANTRFPGYSDPNNRDGIQYDHPYTNGDGNRRGQYPPTTGNFSTSPNFFSNIHTSGLMLNTTDTCRVTISVNMGPAMRYIDPFVPATDTVYLVWQDQAWYRNQEANQGTPFPNTRMMTRNGPTDSVWSVNFRVKGKTHYGLMYNYEFRHVGSGSVSEGGGLGVQNPYRSRYIQPLSPNTFPSSYATPTDLWKKDAPLPAEIPPYGTTEVSSDDGNGLPLAYSLNQNYPNPFNPSTTIRYAIPEAARVTLKVFNLLGQEVATLVNEQQQAGKFVARFEANRLASGVYFYRLEAGKFSETKKMIFMK